MLNLCLTVYKQNNMSLSLLVGTTLPLCMLSNVSSADFFLNTYFKKVFPEHYQIVEMVGSRSGSPFSLSVQVCIQTLCKSEDNEHYKRNL